MFVLNAWYVAAWADEIRDRPLARTICNEAIVMYREHGSRRVAALHDRCPHRGVPLHLGQVVEAGLQCGYHGLVLDGGGKCVFIPGQDRIPGKAAVRSFPVVEKDGLLWIWMGDAAKADASTIVDCWWHNDAATWPHKQEMYRVKANAMFLVDNLMDLTHLGYVHKSTIGGNPRAHTEAEMKVTPKETGLHFMRWLMNQDPPPSFRKAVPFKGKVDRWMEFEFFAPGAIVQWSGALDVDRDARRNRDQDGGFSVRLFHGLTPETESSSYYFWSTANGYRQDDPQAGETFFNEIALAFNEDKLVVEAQQLALDRHGDEGLVDMVSDSARVHMRRIVNRMMTGEAAAGSAG
jgi:phenylpropionate dioxygenase-like ring-hydroxylating dioxygenase large terminal subunit